MPAQSPSTSNARSVTTSRTITQDDYTEDSVTAGIFRLLIDLDIPLEFDSAEFKLYQPASGVFGQSFTMNLLSRLDTDIYHWAMSSETPVASGQGSPNIFPAVSIMTIGKGLYFRGTTTARGGVYPTISPVSQDIQIIAVSSASSNQCAMIPPNPVLELKIRATLSAPVINATLFTTYFRA